DAAANGHFVYAVRTTRVYCHPGYAGRLPKRENVEFFDSAAAAAAAGYPPSRRNGAEPDGVAPSWAECVAQPCRRVASVDASPDAGLLSPRLRRSTAQAGERGVFRFRCGR